MTRQTAKGLGLMIASNVGFCVMSALIRYAKDIDSFKTTLFRFVIGLSLLGTAALFGKINLRFNDGRKLFFRGLFGGIAVFTFFLSIAKLGISKGTILNYSYPIFACIWGVLFLREKVSFGKICAIVFAFAGIWLITWDPGAQTEMVPHARRYELIALFGAVTSGIAVTLVKRLHDTDSTNAIFFAQCVMGVWLVIVPANITPCEIGYTGGVLLVMIGIFSTIAQLLMTEGYRYLPVSTGSLMGMMLPVMNYVLGVTIFHESITRWGVIGSLVVLVSCAVVMKSEDSSR